MGVKVVGSSRDSLIDPPPHMLDGKGSWDVGA